MQINNLTILFKLKKTGREIAAISRQENISPEPAAKLPQITSPS